MRALAAPAVYLMLASGLMAQYVPVADPKTILEGLQAIKAKQAQASSAQTNLTITTFSNAAASDAAAIDFLQQAVWATQFVGRDQADNAFNEWKKSQGAQLNGDAVRAALRYTTISLQRAAGGTDKQIFPVLLAYAQDTAPLLATIAPQSRFRGGFGRFGQFGGQAGAGGQGGGGADGGTDTGGAADTGEGGGGAGGGGGGGGGGGRQRGEGRRNGGARGQTSPGQQQQQRPVGPVVIVPGLQDIADIPVSQNIFARWYALSEQLDGLKNWELVPANVDKMYEQFLLPYMRTTRDPRLIAYWDDKIATETAAASDTAAQFNTDNFNNIRRPKLLWWRAEDYLVLGQKDKGLTDMYAVIKGFPNHPEAAKWIQELQDLLTPAVTPAAAPAPATPPAATPAAVAPPPAVAPAPVAPPPGG
jgi:hypothetical protein